MGGFLIQFDLRVKREFTSYDTSILKYLRENKLKFNKQYNIE